MAQIRICDRCKNVIDTDQEWFKIDLEKQLPDSKYGIGYIDATTSTPNNTKKKTFDLCSDCYNAILGILNNGDACIHFVDETTGDSLKPEINEILKEQSNDNTLSPCIKCGQDTASCCGCDKYYEWKRHSKKGE